MTEFKYHEKDDIAVIKHGDYDSYERSIDLANFVVDLSREGDFLGLEVIGASERLSLTSEELTEVEDVEVEVEKEEETMMVIIILESGVEKTSINLPVKASDGQLA